jgi:hypothetical protein
VDLERRFGATRRLGTRTQNERQPRRALPSRRRLGTRLRFYQPNRATLLSRPRPPRNVWKIPRRPEFRLFEKEADGELGRAFNDWAYFLFAKEGRVPVSVFKDYAKQIGADFRTLRQTARALRLDTIQGDDGKYYWVRRDRFAFSDAVGIVAGKLYERDFENNPNKFLFTPQKIVRIEELPDVPSTRLIVDAALNCLLAEGLAKTHIFFDATANEDREGFY